MGRIDGLGSKGRYFANLITLRVLHKHDRCGIISQTVSRCLSIQLSLPWEINIRG